MLCYNIFLQFYIFNFSGHLLTEEAEGEAPLIPSDIMEYSISQGHSVNLEATLRVLGTPSERLENIPGSEQGIDNVVRLVEVSKSNIDIIFVSSDCFLKFRFLYSECIYYIGYH